MGANPGGGRGDMSPHFLGWGTVLFSVPPLYVQNNHNISYCMQYSPYYFTDVHHRPILPGSQPSLQCLPLVRKA